eukprot:4624914-Pleurochrysis_carterae.AAC.1
MENERGKKTRWLLWTSKVVRTVPKRIAAGLVQLYHHGAQVPEAWGDASSGGVTHGYIPQRYSGERQPFDVGEAVPRGHRLAHGEAGAVQARAHAQGDAGGGGGGAGQVLKARSLWSCSRWSVPMHATRVDDGAGGRRQRGRTFRLAAA